MRFLLAFRWITIIVLCAAAPVALAQEPSTQPQATTRSAPFELPEKNLVFDAPPAGWTRPMFRKILPDACLEYQRSKPTIVCSIIAEVPSPDPDEKIDRLVQRLLDRLSSQSADFTLVEKTRQTVNGLHGVRVCARFTRGNQDLVAVYWVYTCPHGIYQVIVSGDQDDEQQIREQALVMFDLFHFKDPALGNSAAVLPPYHSSRYGYSVDLSSPGWLVVSGKARETNFPGADFVAIRSLTTTLMVIPVSLGGADCDRDALAKALLKRMNTTFEEATDIHDLPPGPARGISFSFSHDIAQVHYDYRARVLTANGFAYLVVSWTAKPEKVPGLAKELDTFTADKSAALPDPALLSPRERELHLSVFNDLGNSASNQQQYSKAAVLHVLALQMKVDPVVVDNAVSDYVNAQQLKEALQVVRKYKDELSKRSSLQARAARLEAALGDRDTALDLCKQLFDAKYEDVSLLREYSQMLIKAGRVDEALAAVQRYRAHAEGTDAAILESEIDVEKKDTDRAVTILLDRKVRDPDNTTLNFELTNAYLAAKRYPEAKANAQGMIDRGIKSAWVYLQLGQAQYNLKSYREAKASFESSAALAPGDERVKYWLRNVSGMLGEGDNASIKTEITPVPVPASVLKRPTTDPSFGSDANAVYLSAVDAMSYTRGKEQKSTRYYTIKVLNAAGVDEYNAFHFPFDSASEQIYVNKLEVRDADGHLLATGNVADCYTLDTPREQSANFSQTLTIPVPALKPGCTIELVVTKKDRDNAEHLRYTQRVLSYYLPCASSSVFVRGDLDSIKAIPSDGVKQESVEGGWCWTVNRPQRSTFEPMSADYETYLPTVALADSSSSWEKVATDYLATIKDVLKPDPDATAMAFTLTTGHPSDTDRVAAILKYLQTGFTYQAIEFGRRARIPNKAGQIIHNHYGDCKDHALLLCQLLNSVGMPAHLVLVRSSGPLLPDAPSMDQFNHMIVVVPGKTAVDLDRYFDCTDKYGDLSLGIPYGLAGKQVLILDPDHPRLATIPPYAPLSSTVDVARDESLASNGDLTVHDVITFKGYYATSWRASFEHMDPKDRTPQVHDLLGGRGRVDLSIQSAAFENLDQVDQPLVLEVKYTLPHRFSTDGDGLVGSLPALFERALMAPDHVEPRLNPFEIRFPVQYTTTTKLSPPDSFRLTGSAPPYNYTSSFETDSVSIKANDDGIIQESFSGRSNAGQYPPETYAAYERCRQDLLATIEQNVVLRKK